MHEEQEIKVDAELWEVLAEEGVSSHEFSVSDVSFIDYCRIVNAESIKYGCKEHILSDERKLAITFHVRLSMSKTVVHAA